MRDLISKSLICTLMVFVSSCSFISPEEKAQNLLSPKEIETDNIVNPPESKTTVTIDDKTKAYLKAKFEKYKSPRDSSFTGHLMLSPSSIADNEPKEIEITIKHKRLAEGDELSLWRSDEAGKAIEKIIDLAREGI